MEAKKKKFLDLRKQAGKGVLYLTLVHIPGLDEKTLKEVVDKGTGMDISGWLAELVQEGVLENNGGLYCVTNRGMEMYDLIRKKTEEAFQEIGKITGLKLDPEMHDGGSIQETVKDLRNAAKRRLN